MIAHDLADALESMAEEPTICMALSNADVTELRQAARLLRELEAVRVAAAALRDSGYDGPFMGEATADLFTALRGVGGGT